MSFANDDFMNNYIGVFNYRHLRKIDWVLMLIVFCLATAGIMTLMSSGRSASGNTPYHLNQLMFIPIGVAIALFIACVDHRFLVSMAPVAFVIVIGLLVAVLFVGEERKGATRWLVLGPLTLQPSEQSKLALIFMLAWYFSLVGQRITNPFFFLLTFGIAAIPGLLILKQPNLGTAAALGPITVAMLYVAGCRRLHLAGLAAAALAIAPFAWGMMKDYQRQRVLTFADPSADPSGSGYHTIQSMITVGSGGLTGKGFMQGTQTFLSYLPEHHTDFIFSLLAEEWGFMGASLIIAVYGLFLMRGLAIAQRSPDMAGTLLCVGIVALLAFHIFVNIAITIGIAPVTGIPLPFLSWGRSFYLTTMMCVGVLLSVHVRRGVMQRKLM